ncbi:MAG: cytochrome c biogenesis protein CcsA [Bacteroidota bacterium]
MKAKRNWRIIYQSLAIILITYALIVGMSVGIPDKPLWGQTGRNVFYHVPMWFAMLVLMFMSVYYSIRLLRELDPDRERTGDPIRLDIQAKEAARVGILFNILGLITGILWSRVTWNAATISGWSFGSWWNWDPIQVSALISLLIYLAYFLLRSSFAEPEQRARVAAVYNVFAAATLIPLFFIVPRMLEGLHPTSSDSDNVGGNFIGTLDSTGRMVFYPAILGFIFLGIWLFSQRNRIEQLRWQLDNLLADKEYGQRDEQDSPPLSQTTN